MSSAALALIWWLLPLSALIGALVYVLWVVKLKGKFESDTSRSVDNFQKFQNSFRPEPSKRQESLESDEELT